MSSREEQSSLFALISSKFVVSPCLLLPLRVEAAEVRGGVRLAVALRDHVAARLGDAVELGVELLNVARGEVHTARTRKQYPQGEKRLHIRQRKVVHKANTNKRFLSGMDGISRCATPKKKLPKKRAK